MFTMNRPTGPDKPKDVVVRLRQVSSGLVGGGLGHSAYPEWFQKELQAHPNGLNAWVNLLAEAADEMEQMQKLNGKLYSTLYP